MYSDRENINMRIIKDFFSIIDKLKVWLILSINDLKPLNLRKPFGLEIVDAI